jgi:lipoyl(octanoyl) transferase
MHLQSPLDLGDQCPHRCAMASIAPASGLELPIEWRRERAPFAYMQALAEMEARNVAVFAGEAAELIWLLEHPPVYTAGTSADPAELVDQRFEVVEAGRGGRYTYHGPGQRVGYLVLNLAERGKDVRCFVHAIEGWVIAALANFGVESWRAEGRVGIWTKDIDGCEAKIGAIGVRVRRWVTMHGFSVNLDPDLSHFGGIVPCGIAEYGVTSLARLGLTVSADEWDAALIATSDDFLDALDAAAKRACR